MEVTLTAFRKRFSYDPNKDLLGKGGFAKVYKAFDNEDELFVALKIAESGNETKYNLTNEIKRFKRLHHPNIVQHIEAYEVNTGSTDIHGFPVVYEVGILEYADGGTLADLLKSGTADYRQIKDLAHDIINGLAYLHSNGIIHRDLKPSNILLFKDGDKLRAKITDFGIAKQADSTAASTQLVGTVEYMSPEYFTTGNITPASDLWSLGVMLLEAVTGVHPFGKTTQGLSNEQIINNILNKDISTATENLTEPLKKIITDCLRREPILRPQTAEILKTYFTNDDSDTFSEKTQRISYADKTQVVSKPKTTTTNTETNPDTSKTFWEKLTDFLFGFELKNDQLNQTFAKELVLFLLVAVLVYVLCNITSTVSGRASEWISHFMSIDDRDYGIENNPIAYAFWFLVWRGAIAGFLWILSELGINVRTPSVSDERKQAIKTKFIKGLKMVVLLLPIAFMGYWLYITPTQFWSYPIGRLVYPDKPYFYDKNEHNTGAFFINKSNSENTDEIDLTGLYVSTWDVNSFSKLKIADNDTCAFSQSAFEHYVEDVFWRFNVYEKLTDPNNLVIKCAPSKNNTFPIGLEKIECNKFNIKPYCDTCNADFWISRKAVFQGYVKRETCKFQETGITIKPYTGDTQSQWGYEETEESLPELSKYLRSYHKTKESSILILIAVLVAVLAIVFTPDLLTPNQKKTIRISLLLLLLAFVGYYLADFGYEKYTAYTAEQKQIALAKADSIARVKAEEAELKAQAEAKEKAIAKAENEAREKVRLDSLAKVNALLIAKEKEARILREKEREEKEQAEKIKKYCSEEATLLSFKKHMELYFPNAKCTNITIIRINNCEFRISFNAYTSKYYEVRYVAKEEYQYGTSYFKYDMSDIQGKFFYSHNKAGELKY